MEFEPFQLGNRTFARLIGNEAVIKTPEDGTDLIGNTYYNGAEVIIVSKEQLSADFFDLRTGLAGEILQKFSTYRMKIAIVGDFSSVQSKSLKDFIYESNKGKTVSFAASEEEAIEKLKSI